MNIWLKRTLMVTALFLVSILAARAGVRATLTMGTLQQKAKLIVVATVQQLVNGSSGEQTIHLQIQRTITGSPGSISVVAYLMPPSDPMFSFPNGLLSQHAIGKRGLWFLTLEPRGYEVLPLMRGDYVTGTDVFLPVSDLLNSSPPGGTISQQLLAYLVGWYLSVPNPMGAADDLLMPSLVDSNPRDALAAITPLISSPSMDHRLIGLSAAINLGSDSAISTLASEISSLKASSKFPLILAALKSYPPHGDTSIPVLKQLIGLNAGVAGLEGAAAAALAKIGTRSVMPVMITLLDSTDPEAQLRAASFCGFYALFADARGNLNLAQTGSIIGPFANSETKAYTPRSASSLVSAQYVQFWKMWWSQNKSTLGFTTP